MCRSLLVNIYIIQTFLSISPHTKAMNSCNVINDHDRGKVVGLSKSLCHISVMNVCRIILRRKQFIYTRTNVLGNNYSCKIEEQVLSIFGKVKLLELGLCN